MLDNILTKSAYLTVYPSYINSRRASSRRSSKFTNINNKQSASLLSSADSNYSYKDILQDIHPSIFKSSTRRASSR